MLIFHCRSSAPPAAAAAPSCPPFLQNFATTSAPSSSNGLQPPNAPGCDDFSQLFVPTTAQPLKIGAGADVCVCARVESMMIHGCAAGDPSSYPGSLFVASLCVWINGMMNSFRTRLLLVILVHVRVTRPTSFSVVVAATFATAPAAVQPADCGSSSSKQATTCFTLPQPHEPMESMMIGLAFEMAHDDRFEMISFSSSRALSLFLLQDPLHLLLCRPSRELGGNQRRRRVRLHHFFDPTNRGLEVCALSRP